MSRPSGLARSWSRSSASPLVLGLRLARRLVAVRARGRRRASRAARVLRDDARRCARSCSPATPARSERWLGAQLGGFDVDARRLPRDARASRSCSRASPTRRQSATVGVGTTVLGRGVDRPRPRLSSLLLRDIPEHGRLAAFTVLLAVWAGDTAAYFVGRAGRTAQARAGDLAGQDMGGLRRRDGRGRSSSRSSPSTSSDFLSIGQALVLGARDRGRGAARRPVRVGAQARHGREGHGRAARPGTAACSTASTRSSSPSSPRST